MSSTREFHLSDGRVLTYRAYGPENGRVVFYFHGLPGSRLQRVPDESFAERLGWRVITPDRPGIGLSSRQPGRRVKDWAADIKALADHLSIKRFTVLGVSGGGPYALACAWRMPECVERLLLVSALGPLDSADYYAEFHWYHRMIFRLAALSRWALQKIVSIIATEVIKNPLAALQQMLGALPLADRKILEKPDVTRCMIDDWQESIHRGIDGICDDLIALTHPWGFYVNQIHVPTYLWHGEADSIVPVSVGRAMASLIKGCQSVFIPAAGHFFIIDQLPEILQKTLSS